MNIFNVFKRNKSKYKDIWHKSIAFELTQPIFDAISVNDIIYAEVAAAGACGCFGQAMLYVMQDEQLLCYATSIFDNAVLFTEVKELLSTNSKDFVFLGWVTLNMLLSYRPGDSEDFQTNKFFICYDGGLGNSVFIHKDTILSITDDHFILDKNNKQYHIYASVPGVFYSVVHDITSDKILGVLFGCAVGDALGLGTEFMTKDEVLRHYPEGLNSYSQIIEDSHRSRWVRGAFTDDTEQMLCIANAISRDKAIVPHSIASEFYSWFKGIPMGIGWHTSRVLSLPEYTKYPEQASYLQWKTSNFKSASNGALMRTAIIGLFDDTVSNAESICKLTHYDPRCVGSCVIISVLVNRLIHNQTMSVDEMIDIAKGYDSRIEEYIKLSLSSDIASLKLDEPENRGYTLKTLSAGLWVYFHSNSFESGLKAVVNEGGDADTNAAVACSVLGAKYGFNSIPKKYIDGLIGKERLYETAKDIASVF